MLRSHVANIVRTARRDLLVGDVARLHAQRMGALVWNGRVREKKKKHTSMNTHTLTYHNSIVCVCALS